MKNLILIFFLVFAPTSVLSDGLDVRERIVQSLRQDGFAEIRVNRTFLGRLRFVAIDANGRRREIVVNPRNGVILRDYIEFSVSSGSGNSGSGGAGQSGGEEDEDEDEDEDGDDIDDDDDNEDDDDNHDSDDDEDNSGSGSSNSGSGSSNSGSGSSDSDGEDSGSDDN